MSDNSEQPSASDEHLSHRVNPAKVKVGDLMAFVYYGKVKKIEDGGNALLVKGIDRDQSEFTVSGEALIARSHSADQFVEEVQVTKTKAAEILVTSFNRPLTVCFIKQGGQTRVLRGRLLRPEPLLGRSHVEDLDAPARDRIRLVDHRTIKYLIVEGVKYTVKERKQTQPVKSAEQ
jgi:hypothetical protein